MLSISPNQLKVLGQEKRDSFWIQFRDSLQGIREYHYLSRNDKYWQTWVDQTQLLAQAFYVETDKAMAVHAMFSLFFGRRYSDDLRQSWIQELMLDELGRLDYRKLDLSQDRLIDIAVLSMEAVSGPQGKLREASLMRLIDFAHQPQWPAWSSVETLLFRLLPGVIEDMEEQNFQKLLRRVNEVSQRFALNDQIRGPMLLASAYFGPDAWVDQAFPQLYRPVAKLLQLETNAMLGALEKQALECLGPRLVAAPNAPQNQLGKPIV
jgi:hypothetical protein